MADGNGTKLAAKSGYQNGEYIFNMNSASASSHSLDMGDSGKIYLLNSTVARTITLPKVKAGGFITGHDYYRVPPGKDQEGVHYAVHEFFTHEEITSGEQCWFHAVLD